MTTTRWKVEHDEEAQASYIFDNGDYSPFAMLSYTIMDIGHDGQPERAEQIIREHNAHAAMVEALDQLQKYVGMRDANGNEIKLVLKAQAALQLARGEQ